MRDAGNMFRLLVYESVQTINRVRHSGCSTRVLKQGILIDAQSNRSFASPGAGHRSTLAKYIITPCSDLNTLPIHV